MDTVRRTFLPSISRNKAMITDVIPKNLRKKSINDSKEISIDFRIIEKICNQ